MTPTRLRQIAEQLEKACSAYQEKIMKTGDYKPCRTCKEMALELRAFAAADMKPGPMPAAKGQPPRTSNHEPEHTGAANL